jgi:hypothetical protein
VTIPPDPREHYVTPAEVAALVGVDPGDARLERVCAATDQVIDGYYGAATVASRLPAPPWPEAVIEAALTIATPGGYFQITDFVGRLALDPAGPVAIQLDSIGRESWPVA